MSTGGKDGDDREARLAARLRENLKRRKQQSRALQPREPATPASHDPALPPTLPKPTPDG